MDETKILFADLYGMINAMKAETKELGKNAEKLLANGQWETLALIAEDILGQSSRIRAVTNAISNAVAGYIEDGPYEGQRAGVTPLEGIAGAER